jgi:predicted ferric reductase
MGVSTRRFLWGGFWIALYLLLTLAPLFVLLVEPRPPGRAFWREFSVALGFAGLAMLALQFAITARLKSVKAPYGSDIIYYFHRQISLMAFALILAHPIILFITSPGTIGLLNLLNAPWQARVGVIALTCLIALVVTSLWRKLLKISYTPWRVWHGLLATAAVSLGLIHVVLVGYHVNTPWKAGLWASYAMFWVLLLVYVRVIKPLLLLRHPYAVEQVIEERGDVWTVVLRPDGHTGMKFLPGQFAWLTAWHSPFSDTEHPFSFSSSAAHSERLALTIKEFGDFTRMIKHLQPDQQVYLDGPFGAFSIDRYPRARGYIFIAGGIGITPIMSMLRTLADRGDQRPLLLIYGNKSWDQVTFREELAALQPRLNLQVVHVLSDPPEGWEGEQGYLTPELLARYLPTDKARGSQQIFICGPPPMMDIVERALVHQGFHIGDLHSERFDLV